MSWITNPEKTAECIALGEAICREQNAIGQRDRLQLRLDRIREYCDGPGDDDGTLAHIIALAEGQLP